MKLGKGSKGGEVKENESSGLGATAHLGEYGGRGVAERCGRMWGSKGERMTSSVLDALG